MIDAKTSVNRFWAGSQSKDSVSISYSTSTDAKESAFCSRSRMATTACAIHNQVPSAVSRVQRACEEKRPRRKGHAPTNSDMWIGPRRFMPSVDGIVVAPVSPLLLVHRLDRHQRSHRTSQWFAIKSSSIQNPNRRANWTKRSDRDQEISSTS